MRSKYKNDWVIILTRLSSDSNNLKSNETAFETYSNVISETDVIFLVISFRPLDSIIVIEVEVRAIHSSLAMRVFRSVSDVERSFSLLARQHRRRRAAKRNEEGEQRKSALKKVDEWFIIGRIMENGLDERASREEREAPWRLVY